MEKRISIKSLYLLLVISIGLIGLGVGSTYAIFTMSKEITNPISFNSNLSYNSDVLDTAQITVPSGEIVTTTLNITNSTSSTLNYITWYVNNGYDVEVVCENDASQGTITSGSSLSIIVSIINNDSESVTVNLGISSSPDNVVLGDNMLQVEDINLLMSVAEAITSSTASFLSSALQREQISSITFVDNINVPSNNTSVDVSKYTDGSILMWYGAANANNKYDVYIGSNKGKVYIDSGYYLFSYLNNATAIVFNDLVDTSLVSNMQKMFNGCSMLTMLDVSNFNTSKVTDMKTMFSLCSLLTTLNVSNWDTSNVTDMSGMFQGCISLLTLDLSNWDVSKVTTMQAMFLSTSALGEMALTSIGDVGNWNTVKVESMQNMFQLCSNLESINLSNWNVSNVTTFKGMFMYCHLIEELDMSNFNTTKATNMASMFYDCPNLSTIYVSQKWKMTNVSTYNNMFYNCTSLVGGSGTTFNSSYVDGTYARIDGGTSSPGYFTLKN